ncbi:cupin domain-containing protein [Aliarcobacter butzleri]|uniref:cupin domain-containing protein n=1 Tax=Aliarcobacter butzleri TaxID=28197 RepID=UPI0021B6DBDC|nr:cupin domain-containing protein [Aliarcobacter butzleri]MCT7579144.1 cupin domain-containing protein [Aliarcobacter butzleri]
MALVSIKNAEHYFWGEKCDGWHLVKSSGLSVIQERVPHGCSEVRHYHERSEQFFYVLSGIATMEVDGNIYQMTAGSGIHVPAGIPHQLSNHQTDDLVFLVVSTPPSHGDRVIA